MLLHCVSVCSGEVDDFADRDASALLGGIDDLQRQLGKHPDDETLTLEFALKPTLLLLKSAQEIDNPGLPVRLCAADRFLRLTQGQIIAFLAVLDDAFHRRIRHVTVATA